MNKIPFFYVLLLWAFAVALAFWQLVWFSVFVLCLSFVAYAMVIGPNINNNGHGE